MSDWPWVWTVVQMGHRVVLLDLLSESVRRDITRRYVNLKLTGRGGWRPRRAPAGPARHSP